MYQYRISLDVYGAEVTVGSVSSDAHAYWSSRCNSSLENHLVSDEEPSDADVDPKAGYINTGSHKQMTRMPGND